MDGVLPMSALVTVALLPLSARSRHSGWLTYSTEVRPEPPVTF